MLWRNEDGYTLIELFVVMALVGLIIGFAYSVYGFGVRSFERWKSNNIFYQEAAFVLNQFQNDIFETVEIRECRAQKLILIKSDKTVVEYKMKVNRLLRNKKAMLSKEIVINDFHFDFLGKKEKSLFAEASSCDDFTGIRLFMQIKNDYEAITLNLPLALRQIPRWN